MRQPSWKMSRVRGQMVKHAQQLARSGQHADHTTILPLLARLQGFAEARARLEDRSIRAQLDQLCAKAREVRIKAGGRGV